MTLLTHVLRRAILLAAMAGLGLVACTAIPRTPTPTPTIPIASPTPSPIRPTPTPTPILQPTFVPSTPVALPREPLPANARVEVLVADANFPVALAFAPDGRLFYTEKNTGAVRVVVNGSLQPQPVIQLPTDGFFERGMLGIAIDPHFEDNHFIWIYHTLKDPLLNRVVRFREENGRGFDPVEVFTSPIQGPGNHNGGNLHFGPDGMLYVTIGEDANPSHAPDLNEVRGKIHRFDPTAPLSAAPDNPFIADPNVGVKSIYAYGLRNSFDFTFDPLTGWLWATENGPRCDDEINLIVPGGNYGWRPEYPCGDTDPLFNTPFQALLRYDSPPALTGIEFYTGARLTGWENDLFFCAWNDGRLRHAKLTPERNGLASVAEVDLGEAACRIDVRTGPDGALYFTSNEAIYRIVSD